MDAHTITHIPTEDNLDSSLTLYFHNSVCSQKKSYPVDVYSKKYIYRHDTSIYPYAKARDIRGNYIQYTPYLLALDLCHPLNHVELPTRLQHHSSIANRWEESLQDHADQNFANYIIHHTLNTDFELDANMRDTTVHQDQTCLRPWRTQKLCKIISHMKYKLEV